MTDEAKTGVNGGAAAPGPPGARPKPALWQQAIPWLITLACFVYLYGKLQGAAARQGMGLVSYLASVFANVDWIAWLGLMVPYSFFFFLIDSAVLWRVIRWFNAPVRYLDILPIRGSSYILSIINEQVGKGAMTLYLYRRHALPGWEVGSSMLFIMFCEFYYLLSWATLGWTLRREALQPVFDLIPWIFLAAIAFLALFLAFFAGRLRIGSELRQRPIFKAFREAKLRNYLGIVLLRSPALLAAVVVYTLALRLFGVEVGFLEMLGYLPVIFFGAATPGPMRSVAITLWVALYPDNAGEMAAFGFVQHNFFIFFNAAIGLLFLQRANRELLSDGRANT